MKVRAHHNLALRIQRSLRASISHNCNHNSQLAQTTIPCPKSYDYKKYAGNSGLALPFFNHSLEKQTTKFSKSTKMEIENFPVRGLKA